MSVYQKHLDEEALIVEAIKRGALDDSELSIPDHHIETGLAHIFFFGDRVFKQYKIVGDADHFIKGVLAPTPERQKFIQRDFALNQHFSGGVYKKLHSHGIEDGIVSLKDFGQESPHVLCEMERLDFTQNFHEQLLRKEVNAEQLYALGYYTARSVAESPIKPPEGLNWHDLALERIGFLKTFISWLPEASKNAMEDSRCVEALLGHLKEHREEYERRTTDHLVVSMDNHDENVFFLEKGPIFIDVVPPMQSWWYGVPTLNLANLTANIETLMSKEESKHVEEGFMAYHQIDSLPESEYAFTRALALSISAVHFCSLPGKEAVGELYLTACKGIKGWL